MWPETWNLHENFLNECFGIIKTTESQMFDLVHQEQCPATARKKFQKIIEKHLRFDAQFFAAWKTLAHVGIFKTEVDVGNRYLLFIFTSGDIIQDV